MKKNITINLFGSLYAIDEDAYELLEKYEDNIRAYFGKQDGGDEIADDIEHRIAELFEELKAEGIEAISIEHVQDIIRRIGNPEQMDSGAGEEEASPLQDESVGKDGAKDGASDGEAPLPGRKKLFRDPQDKMLGGVMSGLSHYFGGDVLIWRLAILLLTIFTSGTFLLVYIILWFIVPQAKTAEDMLLMNGQAVTTDGIGRTVVDTQAEGASGQPVRHGFNRFLEILMLCLKVFLAFVGLLVLITLVCCLIGAFIVALIAGVGVINDGTPFSILSGHTPYLTYIAVGTSKYFWLLMLGCFMVIAIPIYCVIHWYRSSRGKCGIMSLPQRLVWFCLWIVGVIVIVFSGSVLDRRLGHANDLYYDELKIERKNDIVKSHGKQWQDFFKEISAGPDSSRVVMIGPDASENYEADFVATNLEPGIYRLTAKAFADGEGAMLYAQGDDDYEDEMLSYGLPENVSGQTTVSIKAGKHKVKVYEDNDSEPMTASTLPECVVDDIKLRHPGDIHYGIHTGRFGTGQKYRFGGVYLIYNKNMKLERVGDLKSHADDDSDDDGSDDDD